MTLLCVQMSDSYTAICLFIYFCESVRERKREPVQLEGGRESNRILTEKGP